MTLGRPGHALTVYLHGCPGSPEELVLFGDALGRLPPTVYAPDRNAEEPGLPFAGYLDNLALRIASVKPQEPLRLIGFSVGAFVALLLAHRLGDRVSSIDLIAPAAPLELGNFLPDMAGGAVFQLARDRPALFSLLVRGQAAMARAAPRQLFAAIFASAAGGDAKLATDPEFQVRMCRILATALAHGTRGYRREITGYVAPWSPILSGIAAPVRLWHGTADNWAPLAMSKALQHELPNARMVEAFDGLSHYSTLRAALLQIAADDT